MSLLRSTEIMITKNIYISIAIVLIQMLISNVAWGQSVTFSGQVTRHEAGSINESVRGSVYIHYGDSGFSEYIEVPFSIEAGQRIASYSKHVDWSLAGSVDTGFSDHDYFRVSVRCLENCDAANAFDDHAYFYENGKTALYSFFHSTPIHTEIEKFGEDDRGGGYTVNFSLLPKYAHIEGTLVLPNGISAPDNLNIDLVNYEFNGSLTTIMTIHQQDLTFPKGSSEANFRFQKDLTDISSGSYRNPIFGFQCLSSVCRNIGLATGLFHLDSDGGRVYSNNVGGYPRLDFSFVSNDDSFAFRIPKPIELLKRSTKSITIVKDKFSNAFDSNVSGNVIIEKKETSFLCNNYSAQPLEVNFSQDGYCPDPSYFTKSELVSRTPFLISAGQNKKEVEVMFEEFDQLIELHNNDHRVKFIEAQTIKIECERGCESMGLIDSGYYTESSRYTSRSATGAKQFLLTKDFDQPIVISLEKKTYMPHINSLLLQDD